jgi:hypothetical protein
MGVLIAIAIVFVVGSWCIWGGVSAARSAFVTREVKVLGSVALRGIAALAAGMVFPFFALSFAAFLVLVMYSWTL